MSGPLHGRVVIGYDGSPTSERAIAAAADLLAERRALVVHVWEPGISWELVEPTLPPAPIETAVVLETDEMLAEGARRMAEHGANAARQAGLDAEALAVADVLSVAETLVELAKEHAAPVVVLGAHSHRGLREALFGSTATDVMKDAPCPVLVVR